MATTRFSAYDDGTAAARALRDDVRQTILDAIQLLRDERDRDPHRSLVNRLRRREE